METKNKQNDVKNEENIDSIINKAMNNLKEIIDSSIVFGNPIHVNPETIIIPVTKINVGFVAGGGELNTKNKQSTNFPFAGWSGAGFNVVPVGIITINGKQVKYTSVEVINGTSELIDLTNKIFNSVMSNVKGDKNEK